MDIAIVALILFGSLLLFFFLGIQVSFAMGGISLILGFIYWGGMPSVDAFVLGTYSQVTQSILTALPLYIFMAAILMYSDLADDMYEAIYRWFGGLNGGLAAGTVMISSIFAAMVGVTSVSTATLGMVARPSMLNRGYEDKLTLGVIMAGGVLGILIPPSIIMIIFSAESGVSAGALFIAGIVPGILAAVLFIIYVLIVCYLNPTKGPKIEVENRFTLSEKLQSLKGIILPALVIIIVLGSIYLGLATPTEAGAVGVVGAAIAAATKRKLTFENIKKIFLMSSRLIGLVFWLLIGAVAYARIVSITGVGTSFASLITDLEANRWVILILIMLLFLITGMLIDTVAVLLITAPLFLPVLTALGFDMIWFGILFVIASCIGSLTPPFGISLFVMKGVAKDVSIRNIYASVWPFVFILLGCMALIMIFPEIALWLPEMMRN